MCRPLAVCVSGVTHFGTHPAWEEAINRLGPGLGGSAVILAARVILTGVIFIMTRCAATAWARRQVTAVSDATDLSVRKWWPYNNTTRGFTYAAAEIDARMQQARSHGLKETQPT